jgi:hypothetical protein
MRARRAIACNADARRLQNAPMKRVIVLLASAAIEGETGLLVPPHNLHALVTALNRLLSDPALPRRMGEAGRQRADKYFTMDPYIKRVLGTLPKSHRLFARKAHLAMR